MHTGYVGECGRLPDVLDQWLEDGGRKALDQLSSGSPDVIGVIDPSYVIRYVNWTAPGLTREGVIGSSTLLLIPPDYLDRAREAFDRALVHGEPGRFEMMYRGEHGVLVWVVRVGPIVHEGKVIGAFTTSTDATEERRGFLDRDRFFELSLDQLVVCSPTGHLRRVNPAFAANLGYPLAEVVGRLFLDFVHPDDVQRTLATFASHSPSSSSVQGFENRYRRIDGSYCVLQWHSTIDPLTGDVYAVARDVTDMRATEAQLRHAQKMEAVGQLAGGIAHDFNNLMQAVLANVEIALTGGPDKAELVEHLREIEDAGRRAAELTKQLLVFSRQQALDRVPIDLNELLERLLKLLSRLLPENIELSLRPARPLPAVNADRTQIEQVLINLAVNARDAMEHGGRLTLETAHVRFSERDRELHPWTRPGAFVRLSVADTGVGMTPEVRERAFDPFFTTKAPHGGTGLGLATVYGIVEQHGGFVHLYSELGQGTTFKVYLPVDDRAATTPGEPTREEAPRTHGGETILVAEDEDLVRKPVLQLLEAAGYRTIAASNGREAVELFRQHQAEVRLVLLDVVMPEMGGPEAWAAIQAIRPETRVLFTSGYADDRYWERLPRNADILEKPFRTRDLLARLRSKLDA